MIDLKRNSKKELIKASGLRSRATSIYKQNQKEDFKISRGRFSNFLSCQRCFYLDRVKGLESPGTPGWTLNETTDILLKKEFDYCREKQIPHRVLKNNNLSHIVPFDHPEIDNWRNSLNRGLMLRYKETGIILTGGVDDIWQDTLTKQLIIVDYKSQAKNGRFDKIEYLEDPYHDSYKIQMDFYVYLLAGLGFDVHPKSYFLVCNARRDKNEFGGKIHFDEYLVPYRWKNDWIESRLDEMVSVMNNYEIPKQNESCKNCAYADQYSKIIYSENPTKKEINQGTLPLF